MMVWLASILSIASMLPAEFPAENVLTTIKTRSVHRNKVNWPEVEPAIRAQLTTAVSEDDKAKVIVGLLERMNDVHSSMMHQGKYYAHYEGVDAATYRRIKPLLDRHQRESGKGTTQMLSGAFAYVRVPSMNIGADKVEDAANALHSQVMALAKQKPKGWIVDLRVNGGGNLYPMLLGLQPLLGNEAVGGTIDADKKMIHQWVLKKDGLFWRDVQGDRRFAGLGHVSETYDDKIPVVVLVGPVTASSGQATALAFKQRPNTLFLGEPTAKGYCTVNQPFKLGQQTTLNLAVGFMADRKGTAYESIVLPEQTVEGGDSFESLPEDQKVVAAMKWLTEKSR